MRRFNGAVSTLVTAGFVIAMVLSPSLAQAQRARPRDSGGESGGSTGRVAVPRGSGGSTSAAPARPVTAPRGSSDSGRTTSGDDSRPRQTPYSRPRDGQVAVGEAVPRRSRPPSSGGSTVWPGGNYYGGFYPWGYGGFGFSSYWGGYYDPWYWGSYPTYQSSGYAGYEGSLRLKVKPVDAEVFVDGYYAGRVDEFDGVFQRLRIEVGPHRIEIRMDGYEPLAFEVRILPDHKTTYEGALAPLRP